MPPAEGEQTTAAAESRQASANAAHAEAAPAYDSAERRAGTAKELEARGLTSEQVAVRMQLDVTRGKPPAEAVKNPSKGAGSAPKPRGRGNQVQRSEIGR